MLPDEIQLGHNLTMFDYGKWFNIVQLDDDYVDTVEMSNFELSQIPQVKALIEAASKLQETVMSLNCYDSNPNLIHYTEQVIDDALAPFKCLPGDNEND